MARVRVLVVEDSPTVRHHIRDVLAGDPDVEVTGVAADGRAAIELTLRTRPDVITMDLMLPSVSGLAATEYIMAHCPTPILVVSAADNRAEMLTTCAALAAGAVDVLDKPTGDEPAGSWERRLRASVKLVARIPVITHPRARLAALNPTQPPLRPALAPGPGPAPPDGGANVVAVGASTGGPGAVVALLRALPAAFTVPILLVQHISAPFAATFVEWLGGQAGRSAVAAVDGTSLAAVAGRIAVAPAGHHLLVHGGRLRLSAGPERHSCRPSVDTLFDSVAADLGAAAVGCLLTGMGRDGASGLLAMRRAGARTFAQDEATSVVFGMPREAIALDAADTVLPPHEIGRQLGLLRAGRR